MQCASLRKLVLQQVVWGFNSPTSQTPNFNLKQFIDYQNALHGLENVAKLNPIAHLEGAKHFISVKKMSSNVLD